MVSKSKWLRHLQTYGTTESDFLNRKAEISAKWKREASDSDVLWGLFNELTTRTSDTHQLKMIYYLMALFLDEEHRDFSVPLRESNRLNVLSLKRPGLKYVQVCAAPDSCDACKALEGKMILIEEALQSNPLPCIDCTRLMKHPDKGFCRCTYVPHVPDL